MTNDILEIRIDPRDPSRVTAVRIGATGYIMPYVPLSPPMTAEEAIRAFDELAKHFPQGIDLHRVLDIAKGKVRLDPQWLVKPKGRRR